MICQPTSQVNIRARASGRSDAVGYAECGDGFESDGRKRGGFVHVTASIEAGEGWICAGYVVSEKPIFVGGRRKIIGNGKVATRARIGGKRTGWVRPGDIVTVYWMAEWAVTSAGYIRSEYIGEGGA